MHGPRLLQVRDAGHEAVDFTANALQRSRCGKIQTARPAAINLVIRRTRLPFIWICSDEVVALHVEELQIHRNGEIRPALRVK